MKTFAIACGCMLAGVSLFAQSKKEIKAYKIKSTTETVTSFETGKEVTWKAEYDAYDKDGNTTEQTTWFTDGSVNRKELNKFNSKGDKVEEIVIDNKAKVNTPDDDKYKHVANKYNANGDKIEETYFDEKGVQIKKTVTTYNSKGDKTQELTTDAAGKQLKKITYTYDGKGLRTEKAVYGPGDKLLRKHKFTYTF